MELMVSNLEFQQTGTSQNSSGIGVSIQVVTIITMQLMQIWINTL